MTTHIERVLTEVIPEPETPAESQGDRPSWQEVERVRRAFAELRRLALRTRAEGFDD